MSDQTNPPAIELLMILSAQTQTVTSISETPLGGHIIYDVVGGTFEGPKLAGRVPASGGDWVTRTATGSRLNVRLLLETHDGATILFQYSGRASQSEGKLRIEVAGTFEAPQGPYAWLNDVQTFGTGVVSSAGVRYYFYRFK